MAYVIFVMIQYTLRNDLRRIRLFNRSKTLRLFKSFSLNIERVALYWLEQQNLSHKSLMLALHFILNRDVTMSRSIVVNLKVLLREKWMV